MIAASTIEAPAVLRTGLPALDELLGIGGWPCGRVVEVFGPPSSGKTTLALLGIAEAQRSGAPGMPSVAALVDTGTIDTSYVAKCGVDVGKLLVSQPDSVGQALEVVEGLVRSGAVDLVVVKLRLRDEVAHDGTPRLLSRSLRKLTASAVRTGCCVLFVNDALQRSGVTFGTGEVVSGGNAFKFYASMRVDVREVADTSGVGVWTRLKVVKNKFAPPFQTINVPDWRSR